MSTSNPIFMHICLPSCYFNSKEFSSSSTSSPTFISWAAECKDNAFNSGDLVPKAALVDTRLLQKCLSMIWVTKHIIRLNTLKTRPIWVGYDFAYFSRLLFIYEKIMWMIGYYSRLYENNWSSCQKATWQFMCIPLPVL